MTFGRPWVVSWSSRVALWPGTAAAQGGVGAAWQATPGHLARSVAHLVGIGGGVARVTGHGRRLTTDRPRSVRRSCRAALVVALLSTAGVASVQGGSSTPAVDSFRSIVHLVGIATAATLAYYAVRTRRQFAGGVFARSGTLTAVGAGRFALAFLVLELDHQFGIGAFAVLGTQGRLAVRMGLFTTTVFAFGWGLYLVANTLQEWELA